MKIERNTPVSISELNAADLPEAAKMVAIAMSANPLHLAIFKNTHHAALRKQERILLFALQMRHNKIYIAKHDDRIVGLMCYCSSEYCQMPLLGKLISILKMSALGSQLFPVIKWRMNWEKHDYKHPHLHFGPLAVDPAFRNRGIGKTLLQHFCTYTDSISQTGYLETDKKENVVLYEKFGFRVVETDVLFGVKNWFMLRDPTS